MNNPVDQLKQMARNLHKTKSGVRRVNILHPRRDWLFGLTIGVCILVGVSVWNGYMYLENRDGGSTDVEISVSNPRYQAAVVDQALDIFTNKAAEFSAINNGTLFVPTSESDGGEEVATTTSEVVLEAPESEERDEAEVQFSVPETESDLTPIAPQNSELDTDPAAIESSDTPTESTSESEIPQLVQ